MAGGSGAPRRRGARAGRWGSSGSGGFEEAVEQLTDYEAAGLGLVAVAEAYSFDSVSQLGYIAARTKKMEIASAIFQLYTRTPSLTAMTLPGERRLATLAA